MSTLDPKPDRIARQPKRVVIASLAGTTVEWYEFFVYGLAAALVFDDLFFPADDPVVSKVLSMATFAIAFFSRPLGAVVFGHYGDRIGRKTLLVVTLTIMGVSTFLIGLLPSYAQIGIWAPILLVLLRFIQGFSLGGEYGGAVLMSVEHAPEKRRGFLSSIVNTGSAWGLMLANLVFLALSGLSKEDFASFGWRIPFWFSAVLIVIGLVIRLKLGESPEFAEARDNKKIDKLPILTVLQKHSYMVVLMALSYIGLGTVFYVVTVFSIDFGTDDLAISEGLILKAILACTITAVVLIPLFGWMSDIIGRKRIFIGGLVGMAVLPWAWFPMFASNNTLLMFIGFIVIFVPYCATYGTMPAFYTLVFPVKIRYTGLSIGYTLGTLVTSLAPVVAVFLVGKSGSWISIGLLMSGACIVSIIASVLLKELAAKKTTAPEGGPVAQRT